MSEPECVGCEETVHGMSLRLFEDGLGRWICDPCHDELREEYGTVLVE